MSATDYLSPGTLEEALKALDAHRGAATVIAGGTDLIPRMRAGIIKPSILIDLRLISLHYTQQDERFIRIGALTTHTELLESAVLSKHLPLLVEAAREIAGPPVRNRATIGGNLINASPAADLATPLLVYEAQVIIEKLGSQRVVELDSFFVKPGKTILQSDEILTEIRVPMPSPLMETKFIKLGKRKAMAISVVSVALGIIYTCDCISFARIALGSVAPTPVRGRRAEAFLIGKTPNEHTFKECGNIATADCSPISDIRAGANYRRKMVSVLMKRALINACNPCGEKVENE